AVGDHGRALEQLGGARHHLLEVRRLGSDDRIALVGALLDDGAGVAAAGDLHEGEAGDALRLELGDGVFLDRRARIDLDADADALDILGIEPDVEDAADRHALVAHRRALAQPAHRAAEIDVVDRAFALDLAADQPDHRDEDADKHHDDEAADGDI